MSTYSSVLNYMYLGGGITLMLFYWYSRGITKGRFMSKGTGAKKAVKKPKKAKVSSTI